MYSIARPLTPGSHGSPLSSSGQTIWCRSNEAKMVRKRAAKTGAPLPDKRVRGSETWRPVMALLDLASRKQLLRVDWESRDGPLKFRPLQEACGDISPSLLNRRIKELREAELVELSIEGYRLTALGSMFESISAWANRWAESIKRRSTKN